MASPTCAGVSRPRRGVETLLCCGRRILGFERQHSLFQSRILLVSRPSTNLALLRPFVAPRELAQRQARVAGPIWPGRAINAPPSSPPRSVSAAPLPAALRRSRVGLAGQGTPATRRGVARDAGRHRSDCQGCRCLPPAASQSRQVPRRLEVRVGRACRIATAPSSVRVHIPHRPTRPLGLAPSFGAGWTALCASQPLVHVALRRHSTGLRWGRKKGWGRE